MRLSPLILLGGTAAPMRGLFHGNGQFQTVAQPLGVMLSGGFQRQRPQLVIDSQHLDELLMGQGIAQGVKGIIDDRRPVHILAGRIDQPLKDAGHSGGPLSAGGFQPLEDEGAQQGIAADSGAGGGFEARHPVQTIGRQRDEEAFFTEHVDHSFYLGSSGYDNHWLQYNNSLMNLSIVTTVVFHHLHQ